MDSNFDFLQSAKKVMKAQAQMQGEGVSGTADFVEYEVGTGSLVYVHVQLQGDPAKFTPGKHAVHIHEKGDCDCEGFQCAGGHFDPGPSGNTDPDANHPFHAGDLPNIVVDKDGKGELRCVTTRVTLCPGPLCIFPPDYAAGTALMIHGQEDPYTGGESGSGISGGPRLACGVIKASISVW